MKKILIAVFTLLISLTAPALADTTNHAIFKACDAAPSSSICQNAPQTTNPVNGYIHIAAGIIAGLTGAAAIILILISAFKFVGGGGSPESIKSARSTLIAAVIGLVIVALAWTIITFAVDKFIPNT